MLSARDEQMAKIMANMEDEQTLATQARQDQELEGLSPQDKLIAEKLKQQELRSQVEIERLERAKNLAKSDAVKSRIQDEIEAAKVRKEQDRVDRETQAKTIQTAKDVSGIASTVYNDAKNQVDGVVNRASEFGLGVNATLEGVSVPGSIWLPITVLLLFFFLLLPVNGKTRAEWLFQTILGRAQIKPEIGTEDTFGGVDTNIGGFGSNGAGPIRTFTR